MIMVIQIQRACACLLLVYVLCLGACSDTESKISLEPSAGKSEVLRIITWEDYVAPEVVEAFTGRTGIEVQIDSFENTEELLGVLRAYSHRYDLVIFDNSSAGRFCHLQLLRKVESERLRGFDNLDERFVNTPSDPGNNYTIPYLWGTTLVAYRNDKIEAPEASFELLFDESLKGRVLMLDDMFESMAVPLILNGKSINSYDAETRHNAADRLKKATRAIGIRYVSDKKIRDALVSGEAWAALCYSGDAAWIAEDHPEISYFFPKEGAAIWLDTMGIPRQAQNIDGAYEFINFMLEPEIAALSANSLWCATPNRLAVPLLDEELVSDAALVPTDEMLRDCEFFTEVPVAAYPLISKVAREIRAASPEGDETTNLESGN